jgi:hypothetical protein
LPAGSFTEGFRTPATVQAASLRSAGIRNPQQRPKFRDNQRTSALAPKADLSRLYEYTPYFVSRFNLPAAFQAGCEEFFTCAVGQISGYFSRVPRSIEGRFAIVTNVGCGMRWTRWLHTTSEAKADGENAWS